MKVVAINGSPKQNGNTYTTLNEIGKTVINENIDFEIIHIGAKDIKGCMGCGKCYKNKDEKCVINTDILNDLLPVIKEADGIILGSPVYYSGIAGTMKCFLDRMFYTSDSNGNWFRHKIGASVVVARRSGGTMAFNALNHYLQISEMIIPSSNYWNIVHGAKPGEVLQDEEGIQTMHVLGKNIAWLLQSINNYELKNIKPEKEQKIKTNFIR
ncbi:MAG: flavodoxin family protein [Bacteroidales bacterium]|jgi:multimeric flavodoxin WrbA|nr:flavodoxin family protein [Bacteroidales bacterium]